MSGLDVYAVVIVIFFFLKKLRFEEKLCLESCRSTTTVLIFLFFFCKESDLSISCVLASVCFLFPQLCSVLFHIKVSVQQIYTYGDLISQTVFMVDQFLLLTLLRFKAQKFFIEYYFHGNLDILKLGVRQSLFFLALQPATVLVDTRYV